MCVCGGNGPSSLVQHDIIGNLHIVCVSFLQQENLEFQGSKSEHDDHVVGSNSTVEGPCTILFSKKRLHLGVQEA